MQIKQTHKNYTWTYHIHTTEDQRQRQKSVKKSKGGKGNTLPTEEKKIRITVDFTSEIMQTRRAE